jgi:hypothetical protein
LVAVTDAMVRCGLRVSRAERLWEGGGGASALELAEALETEISQIPDFAWKLAAR